MVSKESCMQLSMRTVYMEMEVDTIVAVVVVLVCVLVRHTVEVMQVVRHVVFVEVEVSQTV